MLLNAARNPRITHHFDDVDIERLRDKLVEQFCVEAGGPCEYSGDSMEESHKGLNIDRGDFNALVEDLIDAMAAEGVAVPVQNRLLARLATMRGQIIRGLSDPDPEKLLFRSIYLDTAQLARIVMAMDFVDERRVGATGGSQGGGAKDTWVVDLDEEAD